MSTRTEIVREYCSKCQTILSSNAIHGGRCQNCGTMICATTQAEAEAGREPEGGGVMRDDYHILILHSEDGPDWTHAILYPSSWLPSRADNEAIAAFEAVQQETGDEWAWDDYEVELVRRGFVLTNWHNGPTWDTCRVGESEAV